VPSSPINGKDDFTFLPEVFPFHIVQDRDSELAS